MEAKQSTARYWFYFIIWLAIMVAMLVYAPVRQFFWLALPGVCTSFAKGLDIL
jgi:hypothetical protein